MPHLLPAAASAIAQAAPAAAAAAAKATVMGTLKSVAFNALTSLAISSALSVFSPTVGASARQVEFVIDPDGPIPFAAGRVGVSGSVVHRDTFGPDLMYYGIPFVLSGAGPITAIESFMADDYPMAFDANGGAVTEPYRQELFFRSVLGFQPAPVALSTPGGLKKGATLPGWTGAHKLSGKAAGLIVMAENSKGSAFPTGEIKPLIQLLGLKGWDPTLDSTYPGGDGPCRLNDASTWVTLTCPILWGLKWALGLWEGPSLKGAPAHDSLTDHQVGGIGVRLSGVDVPAFVSASNIAKANGWTVSAYPNTDDDKHQVLETFLQSGGATYAQRAGKISCISRAAPRASLVTISARDTAGPLEIDTAASRIDRINTLRPRFWSPAHRWQMTAMTGEVTAQAYRDEDGGRTRSRGIDFPFVSDARQTGQLAALQIANTREGIAGVIPLKPHLQRIRPGDAFTITEAGFVLNGLKCLCLNTDYDPATGVVRVSFVSETDAKYPFALGQNPTPPTPQVLTPVDPGYVTMPGPGEWSLTAERFVNAGTAVPALVAVGAVDNATADAVIFEFRVAGVGSWTVDRVAPPTVTRNEIKGLTNGTQYEVAVSYRRGNNYSARLVLGPVTAGSADATFGSDTNRVKFSSFERGPEGWMLTYDPANLQGAGGFLGYSIFQGRRYFNFNGTFTAAGQVVSVGTRFTPKDYSFKVNGGERLSIQMRRQGEGPISRLETVIWWRDGSGAETKQTIFDSSGVVPYGTYEAGFFTVPPGAIEGRFEQYASSSGPGSFSQGLIEPMVAGANAGQVLHPPYTSGPIDLSAEVQWIDRSGRIVDGRGLPINAASGSAIVLSPSRPLAAGSPPDTSVNVLAHTATLVGGLVLNFPSATVAGLSPGVNYAFFRDLVAGAYVPVSGGTTAYFTSADRYLFLGVQTTAETAAGDYPPPPERPPGGGGGYGDIPAYIDP